MIYINNALVSKDIYVKNDEGLFDFPKLKAEKVEWKDRSYREYESSQKAWQFNSKEFEINILIIASDFRGCEDVLTLLKNALNTDGLKLLTIPSRSNRAFLVYHISNSYVKTNYENDNCVFEIKLKFLEPQPFNIQFFYDIAETPQPLTLNIANSAKDNSDITEDQKYISVWFQGVTTERNIEQLDFTFSGTLAANTRHYCVITGDIDIIDTITSTIEPSYKTIANFYFRNGTIA